MIPINKPLIVEKKNGGMSEAKSVLSSIFPDKRIEIVFSCRQGLDIIYQNLYKKYGSLRVAVSPLACVAALYPIIKNKHNIHFVDINPHTLNMDEGLIPDDVQVIQPIHFGGNPQNMDKIISVSEANQQIVVEDCAQGFGSHYNNQMVGTFGDYSVFSLMKNLYALGGSCVLSKDELEVPNYEELGFIPTYYKVLKRLLESKNTYNSHIANFVLYNCILSLRPEDQDVFSYNNKVNKKIVSSIYSQLLKHEYLLEKRFNNAHYILGNIKNENIVPQYVLPEAKSNYTRLYFMLRDGNSKSIIKGLRENGIGANHITQDSVCYYQKPIFENQVLSKFGQKEALSNYSDVHDRLFSLPISPCLSMKEMDYIVYNLDQLVR